MPTSGKAFTKILKVCKGKENTENSDQSNSLNGLNTVKVLSKESFDGDSEIFNLFRTTKTSMITPERIE